MTFFSQVLQTPSSPIGSLITLGINFQREFKGRECQALSQIRSLWNKQNTQRDTESKKDKNLTEADVKQFIRENKELIRIAHENKNSPYAPFKFTDLLDEIREYSSNTTATAVSDLASVNIEHIVDKEEPSKWDACITGLKSAYTDTVSTTMKAVNKFMNRFDKAEIIDIANSDDLVLPTYNK